MKEFTLQKSGTGTISIVLDNGLGGEHHIEFGTPEGDGLGVDEFLLGLKEGDELIIKKVGGKKCIKE